MMILPSPPHYMPMRFVVEGGGDRFRFGDGAAFAEALADVAPVAVTVLLAALFAGSVMFGIWLDGRGGS